MNRLSNLLLVCAVALIAACDKPHASSAANDASRPIEAKPFNGEVYRSLDGSAVLTLISPDECEFQHGKQTFLCKYTRQPDSLRVVLTALGTNQVVYYRFVKDGIQDNDNHLLLSPKAFAAKTEDQFDSLIYDVARLHELDPMLIKAIVWRESAFNSNKIGASGARGLMQVVEWMALDWARATKPEIFVPTDLFDPKTNLQVGVWGVKRALTRWKQKDDPIPFALAEYNAGPAKVDRWIAETNTDGKTNADQFLAAIDSPSTRRYIQETVARHRFYKERAQ